MIRLATKARHGFARAATVELPAVVVTLDVIADDPAGRQWSISMWAPIEQCDALPARVAKRDERQAIE